MASSSEKLGSYYQQEGQREEFGIEREYAQPDFWRALFEQQHFPRDRRPTVQESVRAESLLEELEILLGIRNPGKRSLFSEEFKGEKPPFEFFTTQKERSELFRYCASIAEKLHRDDISNLVIVDRSARPVYIGVREYWRDKFPQEKMPGMYFLNPKGFKAKETLTDMEVADIAYESMEKDDIDEGMESVRSREEILAEFQKTYSALMRDKEKPVMVFDSCLHTGNTLEPVIESMKASGFDHLVVASVNPSEEGSKVSTDFYITTQRPEMGCYPFDRDRAINKVFSSATSARNTDPVASARARRLRREIAQVIKTELKKTKEESQTLERAA